MLPSYLCTFVSCEGYIYVTSSRIQTISVERKKTFVLVLPRAIEIIQRMNTGRQMFCVLVQPFWLWPSKKHSQINVRSKLFLLFDRQSQIANNYDVEYRYILRTPQGFNIFTERHIRRTLFFVFILCNQGIDLDAVSILFTRNFDLQDCLHTHGRRCK